MVSRIPKHTCKCWYQIVRISVICKVASINWRYSNYDSLWITLRSSHFNFTFTCCSFFVGLASAVMPHKFVFIFCSFVVCYLPLVFFPAFLRPYSYFPLSLGRRINTVVAVVVVVIVSGPYLPSGLI